MEDLKQIFNAYLPVLKEFEKGFGIKGDQIKSYNLYGTKNFIFNGKKMNEMFFAGLTIQKNFVGFYFMPIYCYPEKFSDLSPDLKKALKGKSCFHLKKIDPELMKSMKSILNKGHRIYIENAWT